MQDHQRSGRRRQIWDPLSKNIDELLDGMNQEREETKEGTYEESLKKIEERIKELGILEEENED